MKENFGKGDIVEDHRFYSMCQAITAALLFGASTPIAKLLLGDTQPVLLAALL